MRLVCVCACVCVFVSVCGCVCVFVSVRVRVFWYLSMFERAFDCKRERVCACVCATLWLPLPSTYVGSTDKTNFSGENATELRICSADLVPEKANQTFGEAFQTQKGRKVHLRSSPESFWAKILRLWLIDAHQNLPKNKFGPFFPGCKFKFSSGIVF